MTKFAKLLLTAVFLYFCMHTNVCSSMGFRSKPKPSLTLVRHQEYNFKRSQRAFSHEGNFVFNFIFTAKTVSLIFFNSRSKMSFSIISSWFGA